MSIWVTSNISENGTGGAGHDCGGLAIHGLLLPFATAIFAKAQAYRDYKAVLSPAQAKWLLDSISDDVRQAARFHPRDEATAREPRRVPVPALVFACVHKPDVEGVLDVLTEGLCALVGIEARRRVEIRWLGKRRQAGSERDN